LNVTKRKREKVAWGGGALGQTKQERRGGGVPNRGEGIGGSGRVEEKTQRAWMNKKQTDKLKTKKKGKNILTKGRQGKEETPCWVARLIVGGCQHHRGKHGGRQNAGKEGGLF